MKVVVNAMPLLYPLTGIGRYIHDLFGALAKRPGLDLALFYGTSFDRCVRSPLVAPGSAAEGSIAFARRWFPGLRGLKRQVEGLAFRSRLGRMRDGLYHEPNFLPLPFPGPTILTVHDLSCFDVPETHPPERVRLVERLLPPALERAAHVIVVAESTRARLCELFPVGRERVSVTRLGVDQRFFAVAAEAGRSRLAALGLVPGAYLLTVGTLEPRKNLDVLFQAYAGLPEGLRRRYPLVLAGMPGWHMEQMMKSGAHLLERGELVILGYVPADALPAVYAGAKAFVYPSRYEGFGLPPLEAMASGVPVVTGNRTSIPEVVGDAGIMVDPDDVVGFRTAIRALLEDPALASGFAERGRNRARTFSWERCADATLSVYSRVAAEHGVLP